MSTLRVGFVGVGSQGGPMARRIAEEGHPTTLWARRPESLEPFAGTAAHTAESRRALGAASDVLCVCVVGDADVEEVLSGGEGALGGMEPGGIVVIHSTVHPATCGRLQDENPHLYFLDAPVSGGGHRAAAGQLLVMVGGDADVLARCRTVLEAFGDPLVHVGPLGAGQEAKLINNALFCAQLGLASSAFDLASERGLDVAALATVLGSGSGRSYAAEVLAGAGHDLEVMGQLAGTLLAKDVAILADLLAPSTSSLTDAARRTLDAMGTGSTAAGAPSA